jgi:DNA-binding transcriptional LysR family regulator
MDRLLSMRVFCKVAALGSFSRAASELDMSNAVVSRLVSDLEQHLHIRLLNRSTRSVNLTEAGHEYFARCENILEQIDETEASTQGLEGNPSGRLRMLVGFTEGLHILARHLPNFHKKYPNVVLDIHLAEQVVDIVDKQFDIAIQPQTFVYSNSVVIRELMQARLILCASPAYVAEHGLPATAIQMAGRECITFSSPKLRDGWVLQSARERIRVQPNCILMSNNLVPILGAIRAGMGVGLVFENLVRNELASGALVRVLPEYHVHVLPYFIVYPSRKHLPAKTRVMIEFLLQIFESENCSESNQSWMFHANDEFPIGQEK